MIGVDRAPAGILRRMVTWVKGKSFPTICTTRSADLPRRARHATNWEADSRGTRSVSTFPQSCTSTAASPSPPVAPCALPGGACTKCIVTDPDARERTTCASDAM
eukprot:scaffold319_cov244-Pinguiococcus_pyrenoidosus.AAC.9